MEPPNRSRRVLIDTSLNSMRSISAADDRVEVEEPRRSRKRASFRRLAKHTSIVINKLGGRPAPLQDRTIKQPEPETKISTGQSPKLRSVLRAPRHDTSTFKDSSLPRSKYAMRYSSSEREAMMQTLNKDIANFSAEFEDLESEYQNTLEKPLEKFDEDFAPFAAASWTTRINFSEKRNFIYAGCRQRLDGASRFLDSDQSRNFFRTWQRSPSAAKSRNPPRGWNGPPLEDIDDIARTELIALQNKTKSSINGLLSPAYKALNEALRNIASGHVEEIANDIYETRLDLHDAKCDGRKFLEYNYGWARRSKPITSLYQWHIEGHGTEETKKEMEEFMRLVDKSAKFNCSRAARELEDIRRDRVAQLTCYNRRKKELIYQHWLMLKFKETVDSCLPKGHGKETTTDA